MCRHCGALIEYRSVSANTKKRWRSEDGSFRCGVSMIFPDHEPDLSAAAVREALG